MTNLLSLSNKRTHYTNDPLLANMKKQFNTCTARDSVSLMRVRIWILCCGIWENNLSLGWLGSCIFLLDILWVMCKFFFPHHYCKYLAHRRTNSNPGFAGGQTPSPAQIQSSGLVSGFLQLTLFHDLNACKCSRFVSMRMYVFKHLDNIIAGNLGKVSEHVFSNCSVSVPIL